jgi:hypothetical protein
MSTLTNFLQFINGYQQNSALILPIRPNISHSWHPLMPCLVLVTQLKVKDNCGLKITIRTRNQSGGLLKIKDN